MNMFTGYQTTEELTQNLIDAGCSEEMIGCLLSCLLHSNKSECLCRLAQWRAELLRKIHKEKSCIEYLDKLLCDFQENI